MKWGETLKRKILLLTIIGLVLLQNFIFAMQGYCSQPAEADGNVEVVEVKETKEAEESKEAEEGKEAEEDKEAEEGKEAEGK